jgi:hypothetical protein
MATSDAFATILDTNALRRLTPARLDALLARESQAGVLHIFDAWTLLELLAGFAVHDDPEFPAYRTGLTALVRRSLLRNGALVQPFESQLHRYLLNEDPPHAQENLQHFADTAIACIESPDPHRIPEIAKALASAADIVARREAEFVRQMQELRDKLISEAKSRGRSVGSDLRREIRSEACLRLQALGSIGMIYRSRGIPLPADLAESLIVDVARDFESGFQCRALVLEQMVCDGMDIDANLAWDIEIAHNLAQGVHESDLLVVTDDKVFGRTARLLAKPQSCFRLESYEAFLSRRAAP